MTAASESPTSNAPATDQVPRPSELGRNNFAGITAFLGGQANVMMQLSMAPVGYGVYESKVDSGRIDLHPLKRLRTTLTYLAVATLGTDADRDAYRQAVNRAHRLVRSTPQSPVKYNAFDPELQKWVAACLYVGFRDAMTFLYGPPTEEFADQLYRDCVWLGTSLQMRPEMWPRDRAAFAEYWAQTLPTLHVDETIRRYLLDTVLDGGYLPWFVRVVAAPVSRFFNTGFLPPEFRREFGLPWSDRRQRWFLRIMRGLGYLERAVPAPVRLFPFNVYLWDMRRRLRRGKPLV
jgi:uncharacterized protein (DUF2236 family)